MSERFCAICCTPSSRPSEAAPLASSLVILFAASLRPVLVVSAAACFAPLLKIELRSLPLAPEGSPKALMAASAPAPKRCNPFRSLMVPSSTIRFPVSASEIPEPIPAPPAIIPAGKSVIKRPRLKPSSVFLFPSNALPTSPPRPSSPSVIFLMVLAVASPHSPIVLELIGFLSIELTGTNAFSGCLSIPWRIASWSVAIL